jgi:hypothetical protein
MVLLRYENELIAVIVPTILFYFFKSADLLADAVAYVIYRSSFHDVPQCGAILLLVTVSLL